MAQAPDRVSTADRLGLGEGGLEGLDPLTAAFLLGQRFQAIHRDDGSIIVLDRITGDPRTNPDGSLMLLAPAAPTDPAKPNISFHRDPNTGTFFSFDQTSQQVIVISEQTPEIQRGFQHIAEAQKAVTDAGLDDAKYHYLYEDGKVVPILVENIPPAQDSFFVATDASGQLLVISRLTAASTPIGATPKAADIPPDATVTIDKATGKFKVTQPDGRISFPAALNTRELDPQVLEGISIGDQTFAFNPTTGQFQQVKQPAREFDPGVVTIDGRSFIQGPEGQLTPLGREEVPNLDELINQRIISGDAPGALALADFRDRPTSLEAFNAAMQFAQSPGDVAAISAISRGQSLVAPPPQGTVQRIAEQPEFLQDAYNRLINQFRGGSGSPGEFMDVLTRINQERDEAQKVREASEKEQAALKEKNRKLEFSAEVEAALAPFRDQVSGLETQLAALKASKSTATIGGGTTEVKTEPSIPEEFVPTAPRGSSVLDFARPSGAFAAGGSLPPGVTPVIPDELAPVPTDSKRIDFSAPGFAGLNISGVAAPDLATPDPPLVGGRDETILDFLKHGGITVGSNLEILGEGGEPELVDLPPGTKVTPISKLSMSQVRKLREMGITGMQGGGIVEPLLPFGVRRALAGVTIGPTRRRLSRAAGLPVLSAQARQNLLPEELEVFNRLSREAGIPEGAFRQEQESAFPGANLIRGRARFAPRVLR